VAGSVRDRTELLMSASGGNIFWFFAYFSCIKDEYPYSA
jgi:hypothetical protein